MACPFCGQQIIYASHESKQTNIATAGTNCEFTEAQLLSWKELLLCVKTNNLYADLGTTEGRVNSGLGMVASALNHTSNLCYFEKYLIELKPFILQILNLGKC